MSTERDQDFSAGGVVVNGEDVIVIVPARRKRGPTMVLGLPKGHLDRGETPLQAAVREVREETGVEAEPVEELGEIRYRFARNGKQVDKRVRFYLLAYRSGELRGDDEIEEVRWMPLEKAAHALTYEGEREVVGRALRRQCSGGPLGFLSPDSER